MHCTTNELEKSKVQGRAEVFIHLNIGRGLRRGLRKGSNGREQLGILQFLQQKVTNSNRKNPELSSQICMTEQGDLGSELFAHHIYKGFSHSLKPRFHSSAESTPTIKFLQISCD